MESRLIAIEPKYSQIRLEAFEKMVSVCGLRQLLHLSSISSKFKSLVMTEFSLRMQRKKEVLIEKGLSVNIFPVCFYLTDFSNKSCKIEELENEIRITGMNFIVKFLKLFGNQVKYVVCDFFGATSRQANTVFSCINEYCYNLNRIACGNLKSSLKISLKRSFENVTDVFFQRCDLRNKLCNINKYFPNVKEIHFSENNTFENLCDIIVKYKFLERIEICSNSMDHESAMTLQVYNPDLEIEYYDDDDFIRNFE